MKFTYTVALFGILFLDSFAVAQDQCKPIGYATKSGRTDENVAVTGGGDATPITVTTFAELKAYAGDAIPRVLYVQGPVGNGWSGTSGDQLIIASNKTIIGLSAQTELRAVIKISGGQNIIVRNLVIHGPGSNSAQAWDNLLIQGSSKNIWIDHCEFWNGQDGNADVVKGADNVTFTWCIFGYTINSIHNLSNLIASSDTESVSINKLNITLMFNWFKSVSQRTPRCRFGNVHVVNNLFTEDLSVHASESGVANGYDCAVKTEYNHFIGINEPIKISMQAGPRSIQESTGNTFENTSGNTTGTGVAFTPPYDYVHFRLPTNEVRAAVEARAGATLSSPTSCIPMEDQPTLSLVSGALSQAVSTGTPITDIVFRWGGNATGISVTGLPAGLSGQQNASTYTISGTPLASGAYSITTTQPSGAAATQTGTISVLPAVTLKIPAIDRCEGNGFNETKNAGYEQSAYLNMDNTLGSSVKYVVAANADMSSQLMVRFANGGTTDRSMSLSVNHGTPTDLAFPISAGWTNWLYQLSPIVLTAGRNELLFTSKTADGGPNLDWIGFSDPGISLTDCSIPSPSFQIKGEPFFSGRMDGHLFVVRSAELQGFDIVIMNLQGQTILSEHRKMTTPTEIIDFASRAIPFGTYFVKIQPEGGQAQTMTIPYFHGN